MACKHVMGVVAVALVALAATANAQTWSQVWSDEFNGSGAAGGSWTYETGGGGWGNAELECYQGGTANSSQTGGHLNIQARFQSACGMPYTSARLKTQGHVSFGPGDSGAKKIEGSLQGPMGQGLWPAFWMLGTNITSVPWPGCGEIDIMEHINSTSNIPMTIHWDFNGHASYTFANPNVTFGNYNTYAITWDANAITGFINGGNVGAANIAGNINGTEEFHRSFFILLNLAVGGSWPGNPTGNVFPANYNIDWIRYHQAGGSTGPTPTTPPGATPTSAPSGGVSGVHTVSFAPNLNKHMDVNGGVAANGTKVQVWDANGSAAQNWNFATAGVVPAGYYNLGALGAFCLDVSGGGTADGTKVQLWGCNGSGAQSWNLVASGSNRAFKTPGGKCLDVPSGNMTNGTQLQIWTCNGSTAQQLRVN